MQKWHLNLEYIQVLCSVSPNLHTAHPHAAAHTKNAGGMQRNILRKMDVVLECTGVAVTCGAVCSPLVVHLKTCLHRTVHSVYVLLFTF